MLYTLCCRQNEEKERNFRDSTHLRILAHTLSLAKCARLTNAVIFESFFEQFLQVVINSIEDERKSTKISLGVKITKNLHKKLIGIFAHTNKWPIYYADNNFEFFIFSQSSNLIDIAAKCSSGGNNCFFEKWW